MNRLWVIGDSFTTPNMCVSIKNSFWGLAAQYLSVTEIKNCSRPKNSWKSVMHLAISMQDEYDWKEDFFIIGIPPLERITVFDNFQNTEYKGQSISRSWDTKEFDIPYHRGLVSHQNYGDDKTLITFSDRSWTETEILRDLFLITNWLDSKNSHYLIINLTRPFDPNNIWGPSEFLLPFSKNHPRCILFENTYHSINAGVVKPEDYEIYGDYGHHGTEGNRRFFELSVKLKLQQLGY